MPLVCRYCNTFYAFETRMHLYIYIYIYITINLIGTGLFNQLMVMLVAFNKIFDTVFTTNVYICGIDCLLNVRTNNEFILIFKQNKMLALLIIICSNI